MMRVNWWMLILIGMALFAGQILGTLLMEFWIWPWLEKRADANNRTNRTDKAYKETAGNKGKE